MIHGYREGLMNAGMERRIDEVRQESSNVADSLNALADTISRLEEISHAIGIALEPIQKQYPTQGVVNNGPKSPEPETYKSMLSLRVDVINSEAQSVLSRLQDIHSKIDL